WRVPVDRKVRRPVPDRHLAGDPPDGLNAALKLAREAVGSQFPNEPMIVPVDADLVSFGVDLLDEPGVPIRHVTQNKKRCPDVVSAKNIQEPPRCRRHPALEIRPPFDERVRAGETLEPLFEI